MGEVGECKKVSGYFATSQGDGGDTTSPKAQEADVVGTIPGRNSVPKEKGGSWFGELEKSVTAEGKFIYRPQLSDLTNNVEAVRAVEGRTETPRRNPFKVVPKKDKVEEMEVKVKDGPGVEEKVDSGIGSSQLSIYSIDAESLSFSQTSIQVCVGLFIANLILVLIRPSYFLGKPGGAGWKKSGGDDLCEQPRE